AVLRVAPTPTTFSGAGGAGLSHGAGGPPLPARETRCLLRRRAGRGGRRSDWQASDRAEPWRERAAEPARAAGSTPPATGSEVTAGSLARGGGGGEARQGCAGGG